MSDILKNKKRSGFYWHTYISKTKISYFESKISLDEVRKSINFQANNEFPDNNGVITEFHKYFSNELSLIPLDIYDSWENLGTYVLLLEQESYVSCITLKYKYSVYKANTAIHKNRMQKTSDAIKLKTKQLLI